jgi:hypothetical protein
MLDVKRVLFLGPKVRRSIAAATFFDNNDR